MELNRHKLDRLAGSSVLAAMIVKEHDTRTAGADRVTVQTWEKNSWVFAEFVAKHGELDRSCLEAFYHHLEDLDLAVVTKSNFWKCGVAHTKALIERGLVPRFKVPHHYGAAKVKAATPPPTIISSGLAPGVVGIDDGALLQAIVDWCYGELDRWDRLRHMGHLITVASAESFRVAQAQAEQGFQRISMPQEWIVEFFKRHGSEFADLCLPTEPNDISCLAFCLAYAKKHFEGVPITITQARAVDDGTILARCYRSRISRIGMAAPGVLAAMMVSGEQQASVMAILLVAAILNPWSALKIRHDCVTPGLEPGTSNLSWNKPRAGGDRPGSDFDDADRSDEDTVEPAKEIATARKENRAEEKSVEDTGSSNDGESASTITVSKPFRDHGVKERKWSIIYAVKRYKDASEPLRRRIPSTSEFNSRLLLAQPTKTDSNTLPEVVSLDTFSRWIRAASERCATDLAREDPRLAGLTFTLQAVRNSAIQDHNRRSGSRDRTRAVSQHGSGQTTAIYLNNPMLKVEGTARTRVIQDAMVVAFKARTLVMEPERAPATAEQIGHGVACRDRLAGVAPGQREGHCSAAIKVVLRVNQDGCAGADRRLGVALP